jgi:hypothetical protein
VKQPRTPGCDKSPGVYCHYFCQQRKNVRNDLDHIGVTNYPTQVQQQCLRQPRSHYHRMVPRFANVPTEVFIGSPQSLSIMKQTGYLARKQNGWNEEYRLVNLALRDFFRGATGATGAFRPNTLPPAPFHAPRISGASLLVAIKIVTCLTDAVASLWNRRGPNKGGFLMNCTTVAATMKLAITHCDLPEST